MSENDKIKEFLIEKRKEKRRKVALTSVASIAITLVLIVAALALLLPLLMRDDDPQPPPDTAEQTGQQETTGQDTAPETAADTEPVTAPEGPAEKPDPPETVAVLPDYDYTKPVPESPPVDITYYDDALFIGDSRTEGFRMFAGLNNATYYSSKGLMANTTFTEHFIPPDGFDLPPGADLGEQGKLTVAQAIEYGPAFGKVYIMLGINELGWPNAKAFINYYRQLITLVREHNPEALIYVQLIIPVSKSKSDYDEIYNNKRIAELNQFIAEM